MARKKPSKSSGLWTHFWDMHSGGSKKEKWSDIYIEAPQEEAEVVFFNLFGHNPHRVSCTCCGPDYSVSEDKSLAQITGYHRGCRSLDTPRNKKGLYQEPDDPYFREHYYLERGEEPKPPYVVSDFSPFSTYQTLKDYLKSEEVKVIYCKDTKPQHRVGEIPEQGYVWR